jgi:hypothetical protein
LPKWVEAKRSSPPFARQLLEVHAVGYARAVASQRMIHLYFGQSRAANCCQRMGSYGGKVGVRARGGIRSFESGSFRHSPDDRASRARLHADTLPIGGALLRSSFGLVMLRSHGVDRSADKVVEAFTVR